MAKNMTEPKTKGISLDLMESTINRPKPGQENTVSVNIAPPKSVPNYKPTAVIMGIIALRII